MLAMYLCIGICTIIWIANGIWIMQAVKERFTAEIYIHTGLGIFFTLLTLELTIGRGAWMHFGIYWLSVIGSIALILDFQSILSIILGISVIFCCWMSARKEAEYNINKFGDKYKEYMKKVPMWNIFKGISRLK